MPTVFRSKPVSIRWSLLRNVLLLLALVSLALLATSYILDTRLERKLSQQLIERAASETELELRRFFNPVSYSCLIADRWTRAGLLSLDAPAQINKLLIPLMLALPEVNGFAAADAHGDSYILMESGTNWMSCEIRPALWPGQARWRRWNHDGGEVAEWREEISFDARLRPWYRGALAEGHQPAAVPTDAEAGLVFWTQPYIFFKTQQPGLTVAVCSHTTNQQPVVLAFDVPLDSISLYTRRLAPSKNGMAFVMTDEERVLGLPQFTPETVKPLIPARELAAPAIRDVLAHWRSRGKPPGALMRLPVGDQIWWATLRPYRLGRLQLWIAVMVPNDDFVAEVRTQRQHMMTIMAAALLLGVGMVVVMSHRYSQPLRALVRQTERIQTLDLAGDQPLESRLTEVRQLADAHDRMRTALESFSRYVPVGVVRDLLGRGEAARIGGRIEVLSVLFSDIHDFTAIAESMGPDLLARHLTDYFGAIQEVLDQHHATVDKFIGDAVLAFWGAPHFDPLHALHAVQAALACRQKIAEFNRAAAARGQPPLRTSFGIATGPVVVGNVGSPSRLNYSVLGNTVNIASRLEGINRHYGTDILVSKAVVEATGDTFLWRRVDCVAVKGAASAMEIYEPLGARGQVPDEIIAFKTAYEAGLAAYQSRAFQEAVAIFSRLNEKHPDNQSVQVLLRRSREAEANPPSADGDLTFRFQSK